MKIPRLQKPFVVLFHHKSITAAERAVPPNAPLPGSQCPVKRKIVVLFCLALQWLHQASGLDWVPFSIRPLEYHITVRTHANRFADTAGMPCIVSVMLCLIYHYVMLGIRQNACASIIIVYLNSPLGAKGRCTLTGFLAGLEIHH